MLILLLELISELKEDADEAEVLVELAAQEVRDAVRRSFEGSRLIRYHDLPQQWRSNPYVIRGYRFIPIERWPLIIMSLFAFHNQTLNIHTHLIPFIMWSVSFISVISSGTLAADGPGVAFTAFTLVCLFSSVLWHTMAGCAHPVGRDFCARVDYVGIGWLISASVGTLVYYGFQCYPYLGQIFLAFSLLIGIACNIFSFMDWFNTYEYRMWRISFFLALGFTTLAPLTTLIYLHGTEQMFQFMNPVGPSIVSYLLGLGFYATQIPERFVVDKKLAHWLDSIGVGSHAIWHVFIVLGMSQYKAAIERMRNGIGCEFS
jgi:adiponectin receptor